MTKLVETYLLDGINVSNIPLPHDCEIKDIREDDDHLIIDFEDDIADHDAIKTVHPDAQTLTVRFHLEYDGLQGIYRYRRSKKHGEGYMLVKSLKKLRELMKECIIPATYLYHYVTYHQVIVELCVDDSTLLMIWADSVEFEWTLKERDETDQIEPVS